MAADFTVSRPGRTCPLHYRYAPRDLAGPADLEAETVYVIGGLYGNRQALEAILAMRGSEAGPVTLLFNGDFNWFNADPAGFEAVNEIVLGHEATRGNVETEIAEPATGAGCGCAYPEWVEDAVVDYSNEIMARLQQTAGDFPAIRRRLGALPMYRQALVGKTRIGIVHGDACSLAGWEFSREALARPGRDASLAREFAEAGVRVFACSHTCLPVCRTVDSPQGRCAVVNNGAAGMPNFRGMRFGLLTRISTRPAVEHAAIYGTRIDGVHVDALPVPYDHDAWRDAFLANWPAGSAGHESYYARIVDGPDYTLEQAVPTEGSSSGRLAVSG